MNKHFHNLLMGVSVLPVLAILPAAASTVQLDNFESAFEVAADESYRIGAIAINGKDRGESPTTYSLIDVYGDLTLQGTNFSQDTGLYGLINNMGTLNATGISVADSDSYYGGFVYNEDEMTVKQSSFTNLSADEDGGVFANGGNLTVENSSFVNNHSGGQSGAILNFRFDRDAGQTVGDIVLTVKNSTFTGNYSNDVGAISNYSTATITGSAFTKNHAVLDYDNQGDGGGAMLVGSESVTSVSGSTFNENESGTVGGAIATRANLYWGGGRNNQVAAKLDITDSVFQSNIAHTNGGAVYNTFYNSANKNGYAYIGNSRFISNTAVNGGAIYNDPELDYVTNGAKLSVAGGTFTSNTASENGGAIYNGVNAVLDLSGTNTFTGNTADGVANDIYNEGALTISSGTTTMDGGINGDGTLAVAQGATLNIGSAAITQNVFDLNGTLIAAAKEGDDAQLNISDTFSGNGNLSLAFNKEGTYHLFSDKVFTSAQDRVTSTVYDLAWENGGKDVVATLKSVDNIAEDNNLAGETATAISGLAQSASETLNKIAEQIQERLASGDEVAKAAVVQATNAINPEKSSVVQSTVTSVQNTVSSLASNRMAMPTLGRSGGDVKLTGGGVWAQGLYNKSKMNGQFNGYTRGVAAGADGIINRDITVGLGYAFNHSDIAPDSRDMEINSNTLFLYGQYKPSEWYANAILNYTFSYYKESGDVLGTPVKSDYNTNAFGGQVMTGYNFVGGITPELGLRYLHVNEEEYTNSLGIKNKLNSSDYLTAVLGTKYAFNIIAKDNMLFRPELRYAIKYDLLSDESSAVVTMPGVAAYTLNGDRLSRVGGEFGIGLTMKYEDLDMSLDYNIDVREDYTSQTGMLKFRYNF